MPALSLPILTLPLREQRYSCHGCGNCCRDFTVQLREEDLKKLREQNWVEKTGGPVTIEFRGVRYLRQRENGACVFLMDDGLCRIHKEYGFAAKPIACQLFPFHLTPGPKGIVGGLSFACQSVLENKGAELRSHAKDLSRMAGELAELAGGKAPPPLLSDRLRATEKEHQAFIDHLDAWLAREDVDLATRLDGLAWIVQSLAKAKLENVREERFVDLLDVLFAALPDELAHHPIAPPTSRQMKMLRQAVFARVEDPKLAAIEKRGRWRTTLGQLARSRRFKSGSGPAPIVGVGWKPADLGRVEAVAAAGDPQQVALIDDLLTRWLRASVLGGRTWGAGYYGWSMLSGLQALLLSAACVGWLARLHAAGRSDPEKKSPPSLEGGGSGGGSSVSIPNEHSAAPASTHPLAPSLAGRGNELTIEDVRAALGRVDRTAGRAKWLGSSAERLRLGFLNMDDGLRRLLAHGSLISPHPA